MMDRSRVDRPGVKPRLFHRQSFFCTVRSDSACFATSLIANGAGLDHQNGQGRDPAPIPRGLGQGDARGKVTRDAG